MMTSLDLDTQPSDCCCCTYETRGATLVKITPSRSNNSARNPGIKSPISQPFFKKHDKLQEKWGKAGVLVDNTDKMDVVETHVQASGYFTKSDVKEWNIKNEADKTWANYKAHFIEAYNYDENHKEMISNAQAGFAGNIQEETGEKMEMYLNNLADAATADKDHIQQLTSTNDQLVQINATLSTQIQTLQEQNTKLMAQMTELMKMMTSGGAPRPPKNTGQPNPPANPKPRADMDPKGYCWTHGFKTNKSHSSKTCQRRDEGHREEATYDSIMGGCKKCIPDGWNGKE